MASFTTNRILYFMKNFKKIKEKFNQLPQEEKDDFLQDFYNFSQDMNFA